MPCTPTSTNGRRRRIGTVSADLAHSSRPTASDTPPAAVSERYRPRQPEATALHQIVREHLETFLQHAREADGGDGYPRFVEQAFRRYLECGVLAHGFARIRCPECGHEQLLAFSCKSRLCPSCQARRMSETAAYLRDHLLPQAPYRQWVLTVPWVLRPRLLVDRNLLSAVLGTFLRTVFAWQRKRGRSLGIVGGHTGAVTYIQRFGGALNAHPHFHSVIPDGLFVDRVESSTPPSQPAETPTPEAGGTARGEAEHPLEFVALPPPEPDEVEELTVKIAQRITGLVERRTEEEAAGGRLFEIAASLEAALARALRAPPPADPLSFAERDHDDEADVRSLCARVAGFSLHAGRAIASEERDALERLCRYGLRAPFSQERLRVGEDGHVLYELARPWPHAGGTSLLVLDPLDFLRRLAALLPGPYLNLVRYHGCFASRAKVRGRLPAPAERAELEELVRGSRESERGPSEAPSALPARKRSAGEAVSSGGETREHGDRAGCDQSQLLAARPVVIPMVGPTQVDATRKTSSSMEWPSIRE